MKKSILLYTFLFFAFSAFSQQSNWTGQYLFNTYLLNTAYKNDLSGVNVRLGTGIGEGPMKTASKHGSIQIINPPPQCCYSACRRNKATYLIGGKFQQNSTNIVRKEHYQASFGFDVKIHSKPPVYGFSFSELRLASSISMGLGKALLSTTTANQLFPSGEIGLRLYKNGYITKWSIGLSANNLVFKNIQYSNIEQETPNPFKPFYSVHGEYTLRPDFNWQLKPKAFFFLNNGQDIGMFALESTHELSKNWKVSVGSSYATNNAWAFFGRMKFQVLKMAFLDVFYAYQTNTSFNTPHQIGIGLGQFGKGFHYFN